MILLGSGHCDSIIGRRTLRSWSTDMVILFVIGHGDITGQRTLIYYLSTHVAVLVNGQCDGIVGQRAL